MIGLLLAGGTAFADRDGDRGDRGGGGRDGGGSRDGGSCRSFSGGSSRSFSGNRDGGSSRSFSGNRDGSSSRSFSGGSRDGGSRSFSGGSDRSSTIRAFSGGSDRSSGSTIRSDGDRSNRSFDRDRSSSNTFRSSDGRSSRTDTLRSQQPTDRTYQFRSDRFGSQFGQGDQLRSDRSGSQFRRDGEHQVRRPTERSQQDRDIVDREFKQWRNVWGGKDNTAKGHDNRDWSGNWRNSDRFTHADRIRRDWRDRGDRDRVFGGDWWRSRHRGNYWTWWGDYGHRHNRPWYWWSWTPAPRLGSWLVYDWATPYYWDYGPGEYIYYDNGAVYVNGRWYEPAPVYYEQTVRLVDEAPDLTPDEAAKLEWMPLGVFAVTPDGRSEADVIVQLAVTKDGVVGGTAFDQKNGAAYNIQGIVDKKTQRAVWSYTDDRDKRVVFETSVYNLTQPEATGLVHYGPNDMQVVVLVRLQEPGSESGAPTAADGSLPPPAVDQ